MKFPGGDFAVGIDSARDIDHAGGAEVRPGELLFARPDQLDRLAGRRGQTGRFDGGFPGMLSAVPGTRIGNDHAHTAFGNAESLRQLTTHAKRALRAGPHGELVARPPGDGGARLERDVSDVGYGVRRFDRCAGNRQRLFHRVRFALEVFEQLASRGLIGRFPFGANRREGARGGLLGGGGYADELSVMCYRDAGHGFGFPHVHRCQRGAELHRAQHLPV